MVDFFKKYWVYILIIVILALVFYYFYQKGKGATTIVQPPIDNSGNTSSNNNPAGVGDPELKIMVDNAHKDASSYLQSFLGHDASVYQPLAGLSDTDFVKAYDIWNNEYQSTDKMTMRGTLDSMWGWWSDGIQIGGGDTFSSIRNVIDDKFNRLNLA